jgi:hypothetical protein
MSGVIDFQDNPRNHTQDTVLCFETKSECDAWQYGCSQPPAKPFFPSDCAQVRRSRQRGALLPAAAGASFHERHGLSLVKPP